MQKNGCTISVTAGANFIAEFAQQIAWLAATVQSSPYGKGSMASCCPRIDELSVQRGSTGNDLVKVTGLCSFSFDFKSPHHDYDDESGFCWHTMFLNPIMVTGYPTLRRPIPRLGLEMSVETMASLIEGDHFVQIRGRTILKGYNSLLVATLATKGIISWHFLETQGRISYFDPRLSGLEIPNLDLHSLSSSRHIIGWCARATDFCGKSHRSIYRNISDLTGHDSANLDIAASQLDQAEVTSTIEGVYAEAGQYIVAGVKLRLKQKPKPIRSHHDKTYSELLDFAADQFFTFYDVKDRRAWLVDGASALLYLVRISLNYDATKADSTYDWVFDSTKLKSIWSGCSSRAAAVMTLKDWDNRALPVYIKGRSSQNGQILFHFSTFEDRVRKILRWLEVIIDNDANLKSRDGLDIGEYLDRRKNILGYDLLDLVKAPGPIMQRSAHMKAWNHGWVEMLPSAGITTIFGNGFGDLVRPDDPDKICVDWRTVPTGFDHMTATISTLRLLRENRLRTLGPERSHGEFIKDIFWASPGHPFKACGCLSTTTSGKQKHVDPAQFLIPKPSWKSPRQPKNIDVVDIDTLDDTGAVVFANLALLKRKNDKNLVRCDTSLDVPVSSGQASDFSANVTPITSQSAASTNVTAPSAGQKKQDSQQNGTTVSGSPIQQGRLRRTWYMLLKKVE